MEHKRWSQKATLREWFFAERTSHKYVFYMPVLSLNVVNHEWLLRRCFTYSSCYIHPIWIVKMCIHLYRDQQNYKSNKSKNRFMVFGDIHQCIISVKEVLNLDIIAEKKQTRSIRFLELRFILPGLHCRHALKRE